jgi:hypothetical protein
MHIPVPPFSSKAILHTVTSARIMPGKGILTAGDITGTAFQTTLIIHDHLSMVIELIEVGRTDMQAITDCAAALAYLLIDEDVGLLAINLENVQP